MRNGTKHSTEEYARIRLRNLRARIAATKDLDPLHVMSDGRTARDRLRLDRLSLARWEEILRGSRRFSSVDPLTALIGS